MLIFNKIKKIRDMTRDMNVLNDFSAVTNRIYQGDLAEAVQNLTRQGLMYGYEIEDIIACLTYMVEAEAEVAADVYDSEQYDKRYGIKKD
jgi:hypothetical protein